MERSQRPERAGTVSSFTEQSILLLLLLLLLLRSLFVWYWR
jgi:hypothetical protein